MWCHIYRIREYNHEIDNQKAELSALRLEIDDKQVQLAAAHCEAESHGSELSRLLSRREQLQQERDETDAARCQVQEQIRAVLLYCGQAPPPAAAVSEPPGLKAGAPLKPCSAEETLRLSSQRVAQEMQSQLQEATVSELPAMTTPSGDGDENIDIDHDTPSLVIPAESSLADIRARIETYAQTKLGVEQQIEEQLRATHGVQQQYAQEKLQLERAQTDVQTVSAQYCVLLQELQSQAEEYSQQRHDAEGVLRECSFALDMAVDTMNQKVK